MEIRKGTNEDVKMISQLYDELNDYLSHHINYPGWIKGVYPTYETAVQGIHENNLFIALNDDQIVGTVILRHIPEKGYNSVNWYNHLDYSEIFVVYTFAVHPDYLHQGIGQEIMKFIIDYAKSMGMKAIRLDVYENNIPAIRLYESFGFQYIDTIDLGYGQYGLDAFRLYQLIL